jgi:hypothetical protein
METETTNHTHSPAVRISDRLASFLLIGIGFPALWSIYTAYWHQKHLLVQFSWWYVLLIVFSLFLRFLCSGWTIWAFYKVKPYAIPLAYASLFMTFVCGLLDFGLVSLGLPNALIGGIVNVLWPLFWFAYLKSSSEVENRFEGIHLKWPLFVFILPLVYSFVRGILFFSLFLFAIPMAHNPLIEKRSVIQRMVDEVNESLPITVSEGCILKRFVMEDDTVVHHLKYVQRLAKDLMSDEAQADLFCEKPFLLYDLVNGKDPLILYLLEHGIHLKYVYLDQYENPVHSFLISPEEFARTRDEWASFSFDTVVWNAMLKYIDYKLPLQNFAGCTLLKASVDLDARVLHLVMQLPQGEKFAAASSDALFDYFLSYRGDLANYRLFRGVWIEKMRIHIQFLRSTGEEQCAIYVPYTALE